MFGKQRDKELVAKIEAIMEIKSLKMETRIEKCKEICRNTKGRAAGAVYLTLDAIQDDIKKGYTNIS